MPTTTKPRKARTASPPPPPAPTERDRATAAIRAKAAELGWPTGTLGTDLDHDEHQIRRVERAEGAPFGWVIYDVGTQLVHATAPGLQRWHSSEDRRGRKPDFEAHTFARAVATTICGRRTPPSPATIRFYLWTGSELREFQGPYAAADLDEALTAIARRAAGMPEEE